MSQLTKPPVVMVTETDTDGAGGIRGWARELALGLRFAVTGGRRGWIRTALTAFGVGLGVAMLLVASSIPQMLENRDGRGDARQIAKYDSEKASDRSFLYFPNNTVYRDTTVTGMLLQAEGKGDIAAPPGLTELPKPGEMAVSPALAELLSAPEGALLKDRLPYKVTATIGDTGLTGPNELAYYAGTSSLTEAGAGGRSEGFGGGPRFSEPLNGILLLIVLIAFIALLLPVAVFISTAVRFGGEQRDRRLAALRLVGADRSMANRIAAGESLCGALLGLLVGGGLFALARHWASAVTVWDIAAFPSDLSPAPALITLIAVAVPAAAILVTLFTLRSVSIEPLGVVRNSTPRTRKVWWRVLMPVLGLVLLLTQTGSISMGGTSINSLLIGAGALMVLVGITALLPWLVEAVVKRLDGGPVAWQLATRRLQLSSGTAARAISGIVVAAAGAIALQTLFSSVEGNFITPTGADTEQAHLHVSSQVRDGAEARAKLGQYADSRGVAGLVGIVESTANQTGPKPAGEEEFLFTALTVGDCASLRQLAKLPSCEDGDVFTVDKVDKYDQYTYYPRAGQKLSLGGNRNHGDAGEQLAWQIPADAKRVKALIDPSGERTGGVLATPSAVELAKLSKPWATAMLRLDFTTPNAMEHARNAVAELAPPPQRTIVREIELNEVNAKFAGIKTGLLVGATATMALIAVSLLVTTLEQLRDRKRLLAVLMAFGARRSTLCWSVLWQTAVPIGLGLVLATVGGMLLGQVLLLMVGTIATDWLVFLPIIGVGAGLILLITLLSLPPLWRMMRPDGLRSE
ncbi:ABC transporter permease [Streptomyces amakusaensis]|uniref:FtsX-like permease family protein n=1 Tax=Streptomyces amakusaensis TaxID=67271 RepID=A0ABW0AMZ2_9ACTN